MMKKNTIYVTLALAAAFMVFFGPILWGGQVLYFRDTTLFSLPIKWFYRQSFDWGPALWNPFIFLGFPNFASPVHATFYPLNLLVFLGPFLGAYQFFILVHFGLTLLFTYALARSLRVSQTGSLLAALTFSLSGFMLMAANCHTHLTTPVWMPALFWAYIKALESRSYKLLWSWLVLAAFFQGLQILSGEVHFTFLTLLVLLAFGLSQKNRYRAMAGLGVVFVLAFLLAAIQIFPTLEFLSHTSRAGGVPYSEATQWSFHPLRVIEFFLPLFFGNLEPSANYYWGNKIFPLMGGHPFILTAYLGMLPVLVVLSAGKKIFQGPTKFWAIVGLIGLILSFGAFLPLYRVIHYLPVFNTLRYPEKFLFLTTFSWAIAAALLWDNYIKNPRISWLFCQKVLVGLLIAVGIWFLIGPPMKNWVTPQLFDQARFTSLRALLHALFITLGMGLFLILYGRFKNRRQLIIGLMITLSFLDVYIIGRQVFFTAPEDFYASKPHWFENLPGLKAGRVFRSQTFKPHGPRRSNDRSALVSNARIKLLSLTENWGTVWGLSYSWGYESVKLKKIEDLFLKYSLKESFLNLSGTRWVISGLDESLDKPFEPFFSSKAHNIQVWHNPKPLPRAFLVAGAHAVDTADEALSRAAQNEFPLDRQVILLKSQEAVENIPPIWSPLNLPIWTEDKPDAISLQTTANLPTYLVLNDIYYPGWRVWVDGSEEPLLLANGYGRAVALSPGDHEVAFKFKPQSFKWGGLTSLLGILLAVGLLVLRPKRLKILSPSHRHDDR